MIERAIELICSFCGKGQSQVKQVIAGPTVFICNECVDLCHEIIHPEEVLKQTREERTK